MYVCSEVNMLLYYNSDNYISLSHNVNCLCHVNWLRTTVFKCSQQFKCL